MMALLPGLWGAWPGCPLDPAVQEQMTIIETRDATFGKMTNQNQTDTNEMATTETKYQTDFYSFEKYQY